MEPLYYIFMQYFNTCLNIVHEADIEDHAVSYTKPDGEVIEKSPNFNRQFDLPCALLPASALPDAIAKAFSAIDSAAGVQGPNLVGNVIYKPQLGNVTLRLGAYPTVCKNSGHRRRNIDFIRASSGTILSAFGVVLDSGDCYAIEWPTLKSIGKIVFNGSGEQATYKDDSDFVLDESKVVGTFAITELDKEIE